MKRLILTSVLLLFSANIYSQTGWTNTFVHDPNVITTIITTDSINYFCFSQNNANIGTTYLRSFNNGSNWVSYKLNDSSFNITGGTFINSTTGLIVGYSGYGSYSVVYQTTDGGVNWLRKYFDPSVIYAWTVYFHDQNTGWIGGYPGKLLRTTNGGNNWSLQTFTGTGIIRKIYFADSINGWFVADEYFLGRTTNGGLNWNNAAINTPFSNKLLQDFYYIDSSNYYVLAIGIYPDNHGYVYRTTNSGLNWISQYTYTSGQNTYFYGVHFTDILTGYTWGGADFLMKTTNSGNNWNSLPHNAYLNIFSLFFKNINEIFAIGGAFGSSNYPCNNYVIKSTNAGVNWSIINHNLNYGFPAITFTDNSTGYVTADSGKIFKTTNAGTNWGLCFQSATQNITFHAISFANSDLGIAAGNVFNYYSIYRTTNAGINWQEISIPPIYEIDAIQFLNSNTVVAIGYGQVKCIKSTDGGLNWSIRTVPTGDKFTDISFINETTGFIMSNTFHEIPHYNWWYIMNILKTTDAGDTWTTLVDRNTGYDLYTKFQMIDSNNGYILDVYYGYQKTTDGGLSWSTNVINGASIHPSCIRMINPNTGWIGGGNSITSSTIFKTTNGGSNWIQQFNDYYKTPRSIVAFDVNNAWFCGDYSSIYKTTNGGGVIGITQINYTIPQNFSLHQNYPNPFNPNTKIKFDLPKSSSAKLIVYDLLGREVATLIDERLKPGSYEYSWDGSAYASGIYFYQLISDGNIIDTKKMVLMK